MTIDDEIAGIDSALDHAVKQVRQLRRAKQRALARQGGFVDLKKAASILGISETAARKRAQRGAGVKIAAKWTFPINYVSKDRR